MAKYKVIIQIYKDIILEAPSALDAKRIADEQMKASGTTDRYNVNDAKDLDRQAEKNRVHKEKVKKLKEEQARNAATSKQEISA